MSNSDDKVRPQTSLRIKCGYPIVMLLWRQIRLIMRLTYVLSGLGILGAIGLFVAAVNTKTNIGDFLNMVTDGDGTMLPVSLGVSGTLSIPVHVATVALVWKLNGEYKRAALNTALFGVTLAACAMVVVMLTMATVALSHSYSIHRRLEDGILDAMMNYRNNTGLKMRMDTLQIAFQCCGSQKYSEWFEIPWFATDEQGEVTRDDTPFSCCSRRSLYPCIHHNVMSVGNSFRYAPETNLSISEHGCHTVLLKYTKTVAWKTALTLFGFAIIQGAVCVAARLLQTSHSEKYRFERNLYWHTAWLLGWHSGNAQD